MELFHGSNVVVRRPVLLENQRNLDFGKGFYTTTDYEQARKWAERSARIRKTGHASVSVFELQDDCLASLNILKFDHADEKWLDYITVNRKGINADKYDNWDIVWGPVANDQTIQTIVLYFDGFLDEQETIKRLLPQKLKDQVAFKTNKALEGLKFVREVIL